MMFLKISIQDINYYKADLYIILMKRVYLVCPVNNVTDEEKEILDDYVTAVERGGGVVHYPLRDVNQADSSLLRILKEHRNAMKKSDEVKMYWGKHTNGSFFDVGMAVMAEKPLRVINSIPRDLAEDEVNRMILRYAGKIAMATTIIDPLKTILKLRDSLRGHAEYNIEFNGLNPRFLLEFGMMFMTEKPITLKNRAYVESLRSPPKSFERALIELDDEYSSRIV